MNRQSGDQFSSVSLCQLRYRGKVTFMYLQFAQKSGPVSGGPTHSILMHFKSICKEESAFRTVQVLGVLIWLKNSGNFQCQLKILLFHRPAVGSCGRRN